ncbi:hypothetical protein B0A49_05363 [Cryomyces minteri]|uniref:Uncharacterized protein n=1 Tax=Cryomyces minteri TaxID=331657 RepID=A0A4U0XGB3_9PEZI|nr:hypothetical protein B0A49_05363 [Cryomyces minteri]
MGIIKTAMMTGGGIYAVRTLAKTAEQHHDRHSDSSYAPERRSSPRNDSSYPRDGAYPPQGYWAPSPYQGQSQGQNQPRDMWDPNGNNNNDYSNYHDGQPRYWCPAPSSNYPNVGDDGRGRAQRGINGTNPTHDPYLCYAPAEKQHATSPTGAAPPMYSPRQPGFVLPERDERDDRYGQRSVDGGARGSSSMSAAAAGMAMDYLGKAKGRKGDSRGKGEALERGSEMLGKFFNAGIGSTIGIVDAGGLLDCFVGIQLALANPDNIPEKYDIVRRVVYYDVVDPVSPLAFKRTWTPDPEIDKLVFADQSIKEAVEVS